MMLSSEGLTIGTINASSNSKTKIFKDKDDSVTENFNTLISKSLFNVDKDKDLEDNNLEKLKEEELITSSEAYAKYLKSLV